MKKLMCLMLFCCLAYVYAIGQGRYDANWVFGENCGVNFAPTATPFSVLVNNRGSIAAYTNDQGQLELYYDNVYLLSTAQFVNGQGDPIVNGSGIQHYEYGFEPSVFLDFPRDTNLFRFITLYRYQTSNCTLTVCQNLSSNILYREIDWNVLEKNTRITSIPLVSWLTAVRHANGNDWWLYSHEMQTGIGQPATNTFVRYLVTQDTILGPFEQKIGTYHIAEEDCIGDVTISYKGDRLAVSILEQGVIDLFTLDRCTGELDNFRSITSVALTKYACLEFSPNGQFLYVTTGRGYDPNALYQFDLSASNISGSRIDLWSEQDHNLYKTGDLLMGPDDKIYMTTYVTDTALNGRHRKISVINTPDFAGLSCNFTPFSFEMGLECRLNLDLPNIPNYNLGATSIYQADAGVDTFLCISDTVAKGMTIGVDSVPGVTYEWLNVDASNVNKYNSRAFVAVDSTTWFYLQLTDTTIQGSCQTRIDSVLVERRLCTGIEELHQAQVKVYPNPAKGILNIDLPHSGTKHTLSLYSLLGQTVLQIQLDKSGSIDVSTTPSGLYLYNISNEQGASKVGKLLIE